MMHMSTAPIILAEPLPPEKLDEVIDSLCVEFEGADFKIHVLDGVEVVALLSGGSAVDQIEEMRAFAEREARD